MCPPNSNRFVDNSFSENSASPHELNREYSAILNTETETASARVAMVQIVLVRRVAALNDAIVKGHQFGQLLNGLVHECRWHQHPGYPVTGSASSDNR